MPHKTTPVPRFWLMFPLFVCSCDQSSSPPTTGYRELPEPTALTAREMRDFERQSLRSTRVFLREIVLNQSAEQLRDSAVHIGQALTALRMLEDGVPIDQQRPVLLVAAAQFGMQVPPEPGIRLSWVNPNRESYRFHFLFRGPDKKVVYLVVTDDVRSKNGGMYSARAWTLDLVSWDAFKALATASKEGMLSMSAGDVYRLPYPRIAGLHVCAAVEDRTGRISNFLPLEPTHRFRSIEEGLAQGLGAPKMEPADASPLDIANSENDP